MFDRVVETRLFPARSGIYDAWIKILNFGCFQRARQFLNLLCWRVL